MGIHILVFVGVAAGVILVPGPDTAVVTKNLLLHGRRTGLATTVGISGGLMVWTAAAALGLASLIHASDVAFVALKLAGALYLAWLGVQALRSARHASPVATQHGSGQPRLLALGGFRQGILSNLANPKIGVFFTSLLPQFVDPGRSVLLPFLTLGSLFVVMNLFWLGTYCLAAGRAVQTLTRPRVKATMDRVTGVVLIALGLRLATEAQ